MSSTSKGETSTEPWLQEMVKMLQSEATVWLVLRVLENVEEGTDGKDDEE
jgi:hypothetical protein